MIEQPFYIGSAEENFLKLSRPIIFFDLETTGTSPYTDRIVELYAIKLLVDGTKKELHHVLNPTIPINPGATATHGFTDEMVADKPLFKDVANELAEFFQDCDLAGYNIKKYDVPMLMEEFHRCKKYPINFNEVKLVDAMGIYHSKEKRDLAAALKFYCQQEHTDAHSAKSDVLATMKILKHQLLKYDDLEPNTSFLHDYLSAGNNVDFAGKFVRDEEGKIVFNFGQHKGKEACTELDYLKWIIDNDFPVDTKMVAKKIRMNCIWESEIKGWLILNKIMEDSKLGAALYTTVKFRENIFPFSIQKENEKLVVRYDNSPPASFTFTHKDCVDIMLSVLDNQLRVQPPHSK